MGKYGRGHIGKTFNDGKLVVVDGGDRCSYVKVKCNVCAEDPELFGDGIFEQVFNNLTKGNLPCGCGRAPKWTLEQYEIRIKREIEIETLPISFVGFGEVNKKLAMTPVILECTKSNIKYKINSISDFFEGRGQSGKDYSVSAKIEQYNKSNQNHIVWDSGKKSSNGQVLCGFYCKTCESNKFESLFEISATNLFKGQIPCYCSKAKMNISGDHIVELTKGKVNDSELESITVIGAYKNKGSWFPVFLCGTHGVYSRSHGSINEIGCHCLKCTRPNTGYDKTKQGFLYLLEIKKDSATVLGYGITNNISKRLTTHRNTLKNYGYKITSSRVFQGSGTRVLSVENSIKALHVQGLISCEGFRRESISIERKEEVLELCTGLKEITLDIPPNL